MSGSVRSAMPKQLALTPRWRRPGVVQSRATELDLACALGAGRELLAELRETRERAERLEADNEHLRRALAALRSGRKCE